MIQLRDDLIFAEGGRRYCFVHPDDPGKCIKTLSPNGDPIRRKKEAAWYKRLRPVWMFDDNIREMKAFRRLERCGEGAWKHFPHCYGIVSTSRGDGIVTDLIRDADGQISRTVRQYVKARGKTAALLEALDGFFSTLLELQIITRDVLDHNLVIRQGGDRLTIYMIDGFGSADFLKLLYRIPALAKWKIDRKYRRFRTRYKHWEA